MFNEFKLAKSNRANYLTKTSVSHEIEKSAHANPKKVCENYMKVKTKRVIVNQTYFVSLKFLL